MIKCEILNEKEIQNLIKCFKLSIDVNDCDKEHYKGFHYLSPFSIGLCSPSYNKRPNILYVTAFIENEIVGVLCLYPIEFYVNVHSVSFIDVRKDIRNKGIATNLYKTLNDYVSNDMIIYGTTLSIMGETCKLHELRKNILKNCISYSDVAEFNKIHLGIDEYGQKIKNTEKVLC